MSNTIKKNIQSPLKFVYSDNNSLSVIFHQNELLMALKGWEPVGLEDMTIREQVKTFAEATHVLSTHGAGLVNTLWCTERTKVIEIQDGKMLHKKVY